MVDAVLLFCINYLYSCAIMKLIIVIMISYYNSMFVKRLMLCACCAFMIFNYLCAIIYAIISIILSPCSRFVNIIDVVYLCSLWLAHCFALITTF
jgi:hypothetical protein